MTFYSAVFASASRVRLAHESGLDCATERRQSAAGRHGTVAALNAARELGLPFTLAVRQGAAQSNKLAVLQFLHASGCPWDATVSEAAARRGDLVMLKWVREHAWL
jgi:hypothetical protein